MQQRIFLGIIFLTKLVLAGTSELEVTIMRVDHEAYDVLKHDGGGDYIDLEISKIRNTIIEPIANTGRTDFVSLKFDIVHFLYNNKDYKTIINVEFKTLPTTKYEKFSAPGLHIFRLQEDKGLLKIVTPFDQVLYFDIANPGTYKWKRTYDPKENSILRFDFDDSAIFLNFVQDHRSLVLKI
jgi:hypothetical protein